MPRIEKNNYLVDIFIAPHAVDTVNRACWYGIQPIGPTDASITLRTARSVIAEELAEKKIKRINE